MHSSSVYPGNEKSKNNKFLFGLCRWKEWSLPTSAVHSSNPDIGIFDWSQSVGIGLFFEKTKNNNYRQEMAHCLISALIVILHLYTYTNADWMNLGKPYGRQYAGELLLSVSASLEMLFRKPSWLTSGH